MIYVDGDYERSSSSLEDETVPKVSTNPVLLSPLPTSEVKSEAPETSVTPEIKPTKTANSTSMNVDERLSLMVRIDLDRLTYIPRMGKKRSEELREWAHLPNTRQYDTKGKLGISDVVKPSDSECELVENRTLECEKDMSDNHSKSKSNKRKRLNSCSSISSLSTVSVAKNIAFY